MRHNTFGRKLGRTTAHRLAMFRNQLASLMENERIITTLPKAKELRPIAEKVVTQSKRGTVHARRLVGRWLLSRDVIKKLFDEIAPRFETRPGGYLRIVKQGPRQGDGAEMAVLEFVDFQLKKKAAPAPAADEKGKKAKKGEEAPAAEAAEKPKKARATKPVSEKKAATRAPRADAKGHATTKASTRKATTPKKAGGE